MNVNDKEIFLAIRKHPEEGFRKLMAAYMQPVYWHIRRLVSVHADAEDATQETFVRIYRSIGQHSETGSLRAWIFRIATNEALRLLGRRAGRTTLSLDDASAEVLAIKQDEWFDSSDKLSAKWTYDDGYYKMSYELREDGTATVSQSDILFADGVYNYTDSTITIKYYTNQEVTMELNYELKDDSIIIDGIQFVKDTGSSSDES